MSVERIIPRRGINDEGRGKKHALSVLISASQADVVWLQDDDILPPGATDAEVEQAMQDADLLILPLRMASTSAHPTVLERLQIAEYAAIQQLTLHSAVHGRAVMCSGANLLVRREAWLACRQDLHPELVSGDDMFLLEAMKRRGYRVAACDAPAFVATVRPVTDWTAFLRQRMRWAGKAAAYTDRDIILCGVITSVLLLLQVLCPPWLLVNFILALCLIRRRDPQVAGYIVLLLMLLYPLYAAVSLIGGILSPRRW